ncbi:MAG: FHA domain-containing protein [Xanthomonadales bacterium]|nr:FHA domain-containing protein [Xanthomonadales bacterium]
MSTYRLKGASGAVINQAHTLGRRTLIGRADDCDLRIDQDGIAGHHAEISEEADGRLVLKRLAAEFELRLNGEAIDQASLASGDEIRISNCRWVLQAPGLRPQKVLTDQATRARRSHLPWLIPLLLVSAAAAAWSYGLLPF